jgi:hypothetical protein
MKILFIVIATIGFVAMVLGIVSIFIAPLGYGVFAQNLFHFCKCGDKCIWTVILIGGVLAVIFGAIAFRGQNGE